MRWRTLQHGPPCPEIVGGPRAHEVGLAEHADQHARLVDDGQAVNAVFVEQPRRIGEPGSRGNHDRLGVHQFADRHGRQIGHRHASGDAGPGRSDASTRMPPVSVRRRAPVMGRSALCRGTTVSSRGGDGLGSRSQCVSGRPAGRGASVRDRLDAALVAADAAAGDTRRGIDVEAGRAPVGATEEAAVETLQRATPETASCIGLVIAGGRVHRVSLAPPAGWVRRRVCWLPTVLVDGESVPRCARGALLDPPRAPAAFDL